MSKKEKVVLYNIEIESVAAEGNTLARVDGKVLFVPLCIPGDVVEVRVPNQDTTLLFPHKHHSLL